MDPLLELSLDEGNHLESKYHTNFDTVKFIDIHPLEKYTDKELKRFYF
jgi:hypothetical protein